MKAVAIMSAIGFGLGLIATVVAGLETFCSGMSAAAAWIGWTFGLGIACWVVFGMLCYFANEVIYWKESREAWKERSERTDASLYASDTELTYWKKRANDAEAKLAKKKPVRRKK